MAEFSVYLPPGWARLDLVDDVDRSLDRLIGSIARQMPLSRQPEVRRRLSERLTPRLLEFADHGIACLVLPAAAGFDEPIRPVITFTPIEIPEGSDPMLMLQALAGSDASARLADVADLVAVRTNATSDATEAAQAAQATLDEVLANPSAAIPDADPDRMEAADDVRMVSSRVRYTMGDPDDRDKWIDVQMAVDHPTTPEAEELAQGVIELFDAVISTFRWDT